MEKVPTIKIEEDETKYCFYSSMIEIVEDYTNIDYSNDIKTHHIENSYNCNLKALKDCPKEKVKKNKYSVMKKSNETKVKLKLDEDESIKRIEEVIIKQDDEDDISELCFESDNKNNNKIVEIEIMKYNEYGLSTVIERISNDYVEEIVILGLQDIQDYTNKTKPNNFQKSKNSSSLTSAQNIARDKGHEKSYSINGLIDKMIMPIVVTNRNNQKELVENHQIPTKSMKKVLNKTQLFNTKLYNFQKSYNSTSLTSAQNVAHDEVYEKPYSINGPTNEAIMPNKTNENYLKESVENDQIPTKSTDKVLNDTQLFNTMPYIFQKSYNSSSLTSAQNVVIDKVYEKSYSINGPSDEAIMPIETNGNYQKESLENHHIPTKSTDKVLNEAQSFVCNMCQKSFNARKQIIRHFEVSHNINPVVKNTLQKGKQNLPKSKNPNRKRGGIKRKNGRLLHECALCLKSFSTKSNLVRHKGMHSNGKTKAYKCKICTKCISTRHGLIQHERIHTGEKPYTCSLCSRSFRVKSSLVLHERVHTGKKSFTYKKFKCDVCLKSFTSKQYLDMHKLRHAGNYKYICEVCSMPAWSKSHLVIHRRVHTGEKPYKCDVCLKCFMLKRGLALHKQIHTRENRFKCNVCSKSFVHEHSLKFHKIVHTGEYPFKCDVCSKSFIYESSLRDHESVHTGKLYNCEVCIKSFNTKYKLRVHKRVHTGYKPYQCDVCWTSFTSKSYMQVHKLKQICR
ncbi:zinc finger protein 271-like [Adelges cooleyi]|uniref:zinc finger protein 271-like n=1 Tax=Adelges cooleyi TaxID=133065 RepID=UPI0021801408|nr:zinc finger protein 271-like [Adelges cooleyi]